jgi:uncharacterized membrane protein
MKRVQSFFGRKRPSRQRAAIQEAFFPSKEGPSQQRAAVQEALFFTHFDLIVALGIAVATLLLAYLPYSLGASLRPAVAMLFLLLVPGYVFIAALFPRKNDLDSIQRAALSFGFSIVVVGLIGLGLNFTPWLIRLEPMLFWTIAFTLACAAITVKRRATLPSTERFSLTADDVVKRIKGSVAQSDSRLDKALTTIILVSMLVSTLTLGYLALSPKPEGFTELYILGPGGQVRDYPTQFVLGETQQVVVGVTNHENRATSYDLVVQLNDTKKATTLFSEQIALENNQTFKSSIPLKPDRVGNNMKMDFLLYRNNDYSEPYRAVYLWVNVTQ